MAVHEHEARVVEVEANRHGAFICGHALRTSLVLDGLEGLERGLVETILSRVEHDEATEHDLLQDARVGKACRLRSLIQAASYELFPLAHAFEVLGAQESADDFKVDHLLEAHDVEVRQLIFKPAILLVAPELVGFG